MILSEAKTCPKYASIIQGVQKKRSIRVLCSFCLISPATINPQSCGIFQMKADIHRYVMSTNSFLSDIGELRYRQNNIGYQIIEIVKFRWKWGSILVWASCSYWVCWATKQHWCLPRSFYLWHSRGELKGVVQNKWWSSTNKAGRGWGFTKCLCSSLQKTWSMKDIV